jgi:hypothetical protein
MHVPFVSRFSPRPFRAIACFGVVSALVGGCSIFAPASVDALPEPHHRQVAANEADVAGKIPHWRLHLLDLKTLKVSSATQTQVPVTCSLAWVPQSSTFNGTDSLTRELRSYRLERGQLVAASAPQEAAAPSAFEVDFPKNEAWVYKDRKILAKIPIKNENTGVNTFRSVLTSDGKGFILFRPWEQRGNLLEIPDKEHPSVREIAGLEAYRIWEVKAGKRYAFARVGQGGVDWLARIDLVAGTVIPHFLTLGLGNQFSLTPDSDQLAVAINKNELQMVDGETGQRGPAQTGMLDTWMVRPLPDTGFELAGSQLVDLKTGKTGATLPGLFGISATALSPDHTLLYYSTQKAPLNLTRIVAFDLREGKIAAQVDLTGPWEDGTNGVVSPSVSLITAVDSQLVILSGSPVVYFPSQPGMR